MREAARALDDVSDHLGEVLRRADDLLVEWSKFGAQVHDQVEREAAAVGEVVDSAVGRAAATGIDRAIGERLRALTSELERIEQRARAASRAVVEQREADRRILWAVVAGIVLANALLVVLILRKPAAAPVAEPIRLDAASAPADPAQAAQESAQAGSAGSDTTPGQAAAGSAAAGPSGDGAAGARGAASAAGNTGTGSAAGANGSGAAGANGGSAAGAGTGGAANAAAKPAGAAAGPPAKAAATAAGQGGARPAEAASKASPIALPPPRPGAAHPHKKLP